MPAAFPPDGVDLDRLLNDYERDVGDCAHSSGQAAIRKRAAALLGISFRSLRYRLEKLGLDKGDDDEPPDPI